MKYAYKEQRETIAEKITRWTMDMDNKKYNY